MSPYAMSCSRSLVLALAVLLVTVRPCFAAADPLPREEPVEPALPQTNTAVVDLRNLGTMEQLIETLLSKRLIFIGESHDRYEDHLNQLAVIAGLHAKGRDLAIGMEFFQQPFQPDLDDYVAGKISEKELLRRTQYFDRWRFDYRLYRPILRFAREHGIALLALNLEREITGKVGDCGLSCLAAEERARIPERIDRDDEEYRDRLKAVFDQHPKAEDASFENFYTVQLLWDEGMAERVARYLEGHPEKTLVVLAGRGHLEYGSGIPARVHRRLPVESAIVLSATERGLDPRIADFLLYPQPVPLPASGLLGVRLQDDAGVQGVGVLGFSQTSGAEEAGLQEGDRIVKVGEEDIDSYSDIRIALLDRRPGEKLAIEVVREHLLGADERLTFEVELH